jgi:hypothetical protein
MQRAAVGGMELSVKTNGRCPMSTNILAEYLTRTKLAEQLDKSARTLARWEVLRIGPPVTYIGREPYYRIDAVHDWLKSRETKMVRANARKGAERTGSAA